MNTLTLSSKPTPPIAPGMIQRLRKYFKIMRVSLNERLTYRLDFILSTFLRFLPMVTTILLWRAVFVGQQTIANFDEHEMIAYLLLVHIGRMFSSMPGLAAGIARDIREGSLKKYLLQPIDMLAYLVAYRVAHKIAYILTSALPYGILFFLCRGYFDRFPDSLTLLAYLVSLFMGFLVGFFFEACIGTAGFWFLEVTSFLYVINTVNFFISGQMFPLDLLPPFWSGLLKALPFQYMAYFPTMIFLGKIPGMDRVYGLLAELGWALAFIVLARTLYKTGLRRYSAYGG
ncbi:ABC-2 family transporter protein [soil metagenome]